MCILNIKNKFSILKEVAGIDEEGTSHLQVIKTAEELEFTAKGVKASKPEDLFGEIPFSGIAHVIIDKTILHYVVIHKITEKEIIMVDLDSLSKHHQFELV
ncbi:TPA: hypothetical protein LA742_000674 [Clostridium botulinum]|nr:hypothetical protein C7M59_04040 [Clostridium botulinum]HBJ2612258.1 hypothetical protein [Clostridium botulinum]